MKRSTIFALLVLLAAPAFAGDHNLIQAYNPDRFPSLNVTLSRTTADSVTTFEGYEPDPRIDADQDGYSLTYLHPVSAYITLGLTVARSSFDAHRQTTRYWIGEYRGFRLDGDSESIQLHARFYFNRAARNK